MNVLIAVNRLISFTGSEVIALELAEAFQARGHSPLLFTNAISQTLLRHLHEQGLEAAREQFPELSSFDMVWSQHYLLPLLLESALPAAGNPRPFIVCAHLSPYEPYESATPVVEDLFADLVYANSGETRAALLAQGLAAGVKVFPNPAPSAFGVERARTIAKLSRLLIITNHMPAELRDGLKILAGETGIDVTHIGHGGTLKRVMPEDLAGCDAIVTIGKSTQYALLARIPVYCYDIFGGPGWLNEKNFAAAEHHNFSGRCCHRHLTPSEIAIEIASGFRPALDFATNLNRDALSRFVLDPYIESLIEAASRRPRWSTAELDRLSQNAGQITRVRAMASAIRREVVTLEQVREEAAALAAGLAAAEGLVQKQQSDLRTYDSALGEAQKLASERESDVLELGRGLAEAQDLVQKQQSDLRTYHSALGEAQKLALERESVALELGRGLAEAQDLVQKQQSELRTYDSALGEAQRLASVRDERILHLAEALAQSREELAGREVQLFDSTAQLSETRRQAAILERDLLQAREEAHRGAASVAELERLHNDCARRLRQIENSLIWRLTRPLRGLPRF